MPVRSFRSATHHGQDSAQRKSVSTPETFIQQKKARDGQTADDITLGGRDESEWECLGALRRLLIQFGSPSVRRRFPSSVLKTRYSK